MSIYITVNGTTETMRTPKRKEFLNMTYYVLLLLFIHLNRQTACYFMKVMRNHHHMVEQESNIKSRNGLATRTHAQRTHEK